MNIIRCILLFAVLASFAHARVVDATKNGQVAYEPGLQIRLTGKCGYTAEPEEVYESHGVDIRCYKQQWELYDLMWSIDGASITQDINNPCEPIIYDVDGACVFTAKQVYQKGTDYRSPSILCTHCPGYDCTEKDTMSLENYTFTVVDPCPKQYTLTYVEGNAKIGGEAAVAGKKYSLTNSLETGNNGELEFEIERGGIFKVGPNSSLKLDCEMVEEIGGEFKRDFKVNLFLSKVWAEIYPVFGGKRNFNIRTERFVIGVRGTKFLVTDDGTKSRCMVEEGVVMVLNSAGTDSLEIFDCEAAEVGNNGKVVSIAPFANEFFDCGASIKNRRSLIVSKSNCNDQYFTISGKRIPEGSIRNGNIKGNSIVIRRSVNTDGTVDISKIIWNNLHK